MNKNTLIAGAIAVALLGFVGWNTLTNGPAGNGQQGAEQTGEAEAGQPIVEINVPEELSANAQIGKRGFEAKCAQCHGQNAVGQTGVAPPLIHKIYEPSHHGDMAFQMAVQNGVRAHHWPFGNMPPVEGVAQADVAYIVSYIRELQRANGIN